MTMMSKQSRSHGSAKMTKKAVIYMSGQQVATSLCQEIPANI